MKVIREWTSRLLSLWRRRGADIATELETHRALLIDELKASGMTDAEAHHTAGATLGSLSATAAAYEDQRGVPALETWARELRYALRSLRRTPATALSIVVVLGLGIGVSTAAATVLHALVWQTLPVPEAGRVVKLGLQFSGRFSRHVQGGEWLASVPELEAYRQRVTAFTGLAGVDDELVMWQHDGDARNVNAALVTGDYFPLLRVRPAMGRLLDGSDTDAPVVVVSHRFWTSDLLRDPAVVGRPLTLGRTSYTIVGVAEDAFSGTEPEPVDIWAPLAAAARSRGDTAALSEADFSWLQLVGRLAPGASIASAQAEANSAAATLDRDHPGRRTAVIVARASRLAPMTVQSRDQGALIAGGVSAVVLILILLLICGSNAAALLLARGASREKELAVRIALGAGHARLVQSIAAELSIIAAAGALAGIGLAAGLLGVLQRWLPIREVTGTLMPDLRMLTFAAAYAGLVMAVFGLAPVRQALRVDCLGSLKGAAGRMPAMRLRRIVMATQVAVSLTLLLASACVARGLDRAFHVDPGYSTDGLFIVQPDRASVPGGTPADLAVFAVELRDRLASAPGISAVGTAFVAPFWGAGTTQVQIDGAGSLVQTRFNAADDGYFRALGVRASVGVIPHPAEAGAIVVNTAFAHKFWGSDAAALGHVVELPPIPTAARQPMRIVGVIPAIHTTDVGQPDAPTYYLPSVDTSATMRNLIVHADRATSIVPVVMGAARTIAPGTFVRVVPISERIRAQTTPRVIGAAVAALVGLLSLFVAAVGIHGIVSQAVTARTRDIGIRMALGAPRARILAAVIGTNLRAAAIGAAVCAAGLIVLSHVASAAFRSIFLGLDPADPVPLLTAIAVLCLAVCAAAYGPARRALAVDPMESLRRE
jgi:predicted permease